MKKTLLIKPVCREGRVGPIAVLFTVFSLSALLFNATAFSHHSTNGIYNEDEMVEITGIVKQWRFVNPHPSLIIEVAGDDGEIQAWDVSYGGSAVVHLTRRGYTADTFQPGDEIVVRGYAAIVQSAYGLLVRGDPVRQDGTLIISPSQ